MGQPCSAIQLLWLSDAAFRGGGGGGIRWTREDKKVSVKYHTLELKNTFATKGPENGR